MDTYIKVVFHRHIYDIYGGEFQTHHHYLPLLSDYV